jgi:hypothetical protein
MANEIIGSIFSKDEADRNFRAVLYFAEINSSELLSLCSNAEKYVMFNMKDEKLSILKEKRILLYPDSFNIDPDEIYSVYSKSKIEELLNLGKASKTFVEQRNNVISVSNGGYTLEIGSWCPPICY